MTPWDDLATHLRTFEVAVYPTMTEQLHTPCFVIMPDDPWIEPGGFSSDPERYLTYAVVSASDARSAQAQLHRMAHLVRHNLPEGWDFTSAGAPSQKEHQGITYMAVECRLSFSQCTDGSPYETGETT